MKLYLVRHGETLWNKETVFRGRADIPLSDRGLEQARFTAEALSEIPLAAVYTSPLSRAVETGACIADRHGLKVQVDEGFIDLDYGEWEGLTLDEVKERYPETYRVWDATPHKLCFGGGEGLDDVRERSLRALERISVQHVGQSVVIVTHRVVAKVLLLALFGLDNSRFWLIQQDTCAINCIEYSHRFGWIICALNDTCHLRPLAAKRRFDF